MTSYSDESTDIGARTDQVLWRHLSQLNSALELVHDKRGILGILEDLRDSTRTIIQDRVRPKIRPLNILDLPDELLIGIFDYVKGRTGIYGLYFFDYPLGDVTAITNTRLTCRRFYETSSHLLVHHIRVDMTRSSLAHLDEVSRHPSVSKGVRAITLHLGPFYDRFLAHDIRAFAAYRASQLRLSIENWENTIDLQIYGDDPVEVFQGAITKGVILAESWERLAARGIDTNSADHLMMSSAHQQYIQLYEDLTEISASFAQAIASAIKRMPTASWVTIDDQNALEFYKWGRHAFSLPGDVDEADSLLKNLLLPIGWSGVREHQLAPPPFNLIGELLISLEELQIPLAGLDIATPPPVPEPPTPMYEQSVLYTAAKSLKAISFRPRTNIWNKYWTERAPGEWAYFTNFLRSLLHANSLQKIDLSFYFMGADNPPPLLSMAPLLLSYTWPNLKILHFNGPFHFEELKAVLKPLRQNVQVQWSGYLMSGEWTGVLEFLRKRKSLKQELGDVNGSIYGQECDQMTKSERDFVFNEKGMYRLGSLATQYIQGWIPSNPVSDWSMGELDMPEMMEDDD
ncbi:hypothetical protein F5B18DRAFT_632153 [Nemania serpens]|nr:hypothetical protein F5B18DRAFT_632153 [Nemania serpens]